MFIVKPEPSVVADVKELIGGTPGQELITIWPVKG
jgi:hypothetical protein